MLEDELLAPTKRRPCRCFGLLQLLAFEPLGPDLRANVSDEVEVTYPLIAGNYVAVEHAVFSIAITSPKSLAEGSDRRERQRAPKRPKSEVAMNNNSAYKATYSLGCDRYPA